tara:strand:+ start:1329 stop:1508 length:180 start_codon:yes stop_codon:yes gene_type:complete
MKIPCLLVVVVVVDVQARAATFQALGKGFRGHSRGCSSDLVAEGLIKRHESVAELLKNN